MYEASELPSIDLISQTFEEKLFEPEEAESYEFKVRLHKKSHCRFLLSALKSLPVKFQHLDSSQPWFFFWVTNTLAILNEKDFALTEKQSLKVINYLKACRSPKGGFAGSPYMESHIASTYAAICTLINLGSEEALSIIDTKATLNFLLRLKHAPVSSPDPEISSIRTTFPGAFEIHVNGENDMRATYCVLVIADILGLLKENPSISSGVSDYISQCQTYEGGIACVPFGEAHAGYTFCGLASLLLLNDCNKIDLERLSEWTINRQTEEGGFNGRIGKLVDSCYNFWLGAVSELLDIALKGKGNYHKEWLVNQHALQGYTLLCCQGKGGGLLDKPGKNPDLYHTCYSLAGLSIMQGKSVYKEVYEEHKYAARGLKKHQTHLGKEVKNHLKRVHPVYNLQHEKVAAAKAYFESQYYS